MTELKDMLQINKVATEIHPDAGYTKADVKAWSAARKYMKANPNWDYKQTLKNSVNDVPESVRKAAVWAGGSENLGITDKLKAGGNILAKNVGNWGNKADQLTHARALDNYYTRMKQVSNQADYARKGSIFGNLSAVYGKSGGLSPGAIPDRVAEQTAAMGKNLPGAATVPEYTTMNKIQDVAKTYTGMGEYSKSTQHDAAKASAGLMKPASYAGWAAALGIPVVALLSMLFKGGGSKQQAQAPVNPYRQGYNNNNPHNANQYRGQ